MKKIILIVIVSLSMSQLKAQSGLVWTISANVNKQYFKESTNFSAEYSGFKNSEEANNFIQKMKSIPEVESCELLKVAKDVYYVNFKMKEVHIGRYYLGFLAEELDIEFIVINTIKKKSFEWIPELGI